MVTRDEAGTDRAGSHYVRRASSAFARTENWIQLTKFCIVGTSGYIINLTVYALLLRGADWHYSAAAVGAFLVAVTNNYTWNRLWTFRNQRGHLVYQGLRFILVASIALGLNILLLSAFIAAGLPEIPAQAIAVVLVAPLSFTANKVWSFGVRSTSSRAQGLGARLRLAHPSDRAD